MRVGLIEYCHAEPWDGDGIDRNIPECTHPHHWLSVTHDEAWLDWDDAPAECRWAQVHQYCELDKDHNGPHAWPGLTIRLPMLNIP
jgi:hypothetical protein